MGLSAKEEEAAKIALNKAFAGKRGRRARCISRKYSSRGIRHASILLLCPSSTVVHHVSFRLLPEGHTEIFENAAAEHHACLFTPIIS
jgi:hypothetical protein